MAATDDPALTKAVEEEVGHPDDKWTLLKEKVQSDAVTDLTVVESDWLDLLWTLDMYRRRSIVPRGMGNPKVAPGRRLAAVYRSKGNWYADLIALLLGNRTAQKLAPRSKVVGFSQLHQIDVAWPDRHQTPLPDVLVCLETKVTGAPAFGDTKARGAMGDWSNRRKELKFAATDLKLNRRGSTTEIDHWDDWRLQQDPMCYFLWGARMTSRDKIDKMVREVQALTKTYLDGAGVFAWRENEDGTAYEVVDVIGQDQSDRVSAVDDMLRKVASRIKRVAPKGEPPPPVVPEARAVDPKKLMADTKRD